VPKEVGIMQWQIVLALGIAIPIVLIPATFVLYLTVFGLYANTAQARERRAVARRLIREAIQIIRDRQAVNNAIIEALDADEKKRTDLGRGGGGKGKEVLTPERPMPSPMVQTAVEVKSEVAIAEEVIEAVAPAQVEEVIDEATGKICLPPCQIACPIGEPIQRTNAMISLLPLDEEAAASRIIEIGDEIYEKNPLFTVCSYICGLCERECNYKDETGAIRRKMLKRFLTTHYLPYLETKPPLPYPRGEKVAIVGGGPGGLMCAYALSRKNYQVTILERNSLLGGALRYIPRYRLPTSIIDSTINNLLRIAHVDVQLGVEMGRDGKSLRDLEIEGYQAIFMATGTHAPRPLTFDGQPVAGMELDGVAYGLNLLHEINQGKMPPQLLRQLFRDKKVIVVGGGNVAFDVARTARRLGADVSIVCLECEDKSVRDGIPADLEEVEGALEEGLAINYSRGVNKIISNDGRFGGIQCPRCVSVYDDKGFNPTFNLSDVTALEGDVLLVTIGQGPERAFAQQENLLDDRGRFDVNQITLMSNQREGVFIGGDVRRVGFAAEAMRDGVTASESIDRYLRGEDLEAGREKTYQGATIPKTSDYAFQPGLEWLPAEDRLNFELFEKSFSLEEAVREAKRCLCCGPCKSCKACVALGLQPEISTIEVDEDRCSGCGICVAVCNYDATSLVASGNGLLAAIDDLKCKRCGVCSAACPADAISIKNFTSKQIMAKIEEVLV
jgi:NADPH-dependent glutamate synthase beta subunit-like oxidoreductase/NAD-dependent dihydropyrimidine dehydrogenase PreA subunit